ncbi:MAG: hypothetical protein AAF380_00955, partial [Bacteroidota bacterium]
MMKRIFLMAMAALCLTPNLQAAKGGKDSKNAGDSATDKEGYLPLPPVADRKRQNLNVLVLGSQGGGKTSFINSVANIMYGVEFKDDCRYEAGKPHDPSYQAVQVKEPAAYCISPTIDGYEGYNFTLIDTSLILDSDDLYEK